MIKWKMPLIFRASYLMRRALTFSFMFIVRRVAQAASARRGARAPPLGLRYALPRRPGPRLPWLQLRPRLDGMQRGSSAVFPPLRLQLALREVPHGHRVPWRGGRQHLRRVVRGLHSAHLTRTHAAAGHTACRTACAQCAGLSRTAHAHGICTRHMHTAYAA